MRFGVSIEKTTTFRGVQQNFGNTYYYSHVAADENTTSALNDLIDKLVVIEKAAHSSSINFVRARLWSQIGAQNLNEMLIDRQLTGTGGQSASTDLDKERAFLLRIRAGVDTRGRPVYLRKWFHLDISTLAGTPINTGQKQNTSSLTQAQQDAIAAIGASLRSVAYLGGASGNWDLVAKNGRQITGNNAGHPYIEHHQLGDMWRG